MEDEDELIILLPSKYLQNENKIADGEYFMGNRCIELSTGRLIESTSTAVYRIRFGGQV